MYVEGLLDTVNGSAKGLRHGQGWRLQEQKGGSRAKIEETEGGVHYRVQLGGSVWGLGFFVLLK